MQMNFFYIITLLLLALKIFGLTTIGWFWVIFPLILGYGLKFLLYYVLGFFIIKLDKDSRIEIMNSLKNSSIDRFGKMCKFKKDYNDFSTLKDYIEFIDDCFPKIYKNKNIF